MKKDHILPIGNNGGNFHFQFFPLKMKITAINYQEFIYIFNYAAYSTTATSVNASFNFATISSILATTSPLYETSPH